LIYVQIAKNLANRKSQTTLSNLAPTLIVSSVFTAFLPFCRLPQALETAERQNVSAAAETFFARQKNISAAPDLPRKFRGFKV
jgi:hypothetical protein